MTKGLISKLIASIPLLDLAHSAHIKTYYRDMGVGSLIQRKKNKSGEYFSEQLGRRSAPTARNENSQAECLTI